MKWDSRRASVVDFTISRNRMNILREMFELTPYRKRIALLTLFTFAMLC